MPSSHHHRSHHHSPRRHASPDSSSRHHNSSYRRSYSDRHSHRSEKEERHRSPSYRDKTHRSRYESDSHRSSHHDRYESSHHSRDTRRRSTSVDDKYRDKKRQREDTSSRRKSRERNDSYSSSSRQHRDSYGDDSRRRDLSSPSRNRSSHNFIEDDLRSSRRRTSPQKRDSPQCSSSSSSFSHVTNSYSKTQPVLPSSTSQAKSSMPHEKAILEQIITEAVSSRTKQSPLYTTPSLRETPHSGLQGLALENVSSSLSSLAAVLGNDFSLSSLSSSSSGASGVSSSNHRVELPQIPSSIPAKLYVGNVHTSVREEQVWGEIETQTGCEITKVTMGYRPGEVLNSSTPHRGFCFVEFVDFRGVQNAMLLPPGALELNARRLKLQLPKMTEDALRSAKITLPIFENLPRMVQQTLEDALGTILARKFGTALSSVSSSSSSGRLMSGNAATFLTSPLDALTLVTAGEDNESAVQSCVTDAATEKALQDLIQKCAEKACPMPWGENPPPSYSTSLKDIESFSFLKLLGGSLSTEKAPDSATNGKEKGLVSETVPSLPSNAASTSVRPFDLSLCKPSRVVACSLTGTLPLHTLLTVLSQNPNPQPMNPPTRENKTETTSHPSFDKENTNAKESTKGLKAESHEFPAVSPSVPSPPTTTSHLLTTNSTLLHEILNSSSTLAAFPSEEELSDLFLRYIYETAAPFGFLRRVVRYTEQHPTGFTKLRVLLEFTSTALATEMVQRNDCKLWTQCMGEYLGEEGKRKDGLANVEMTGWDPLGWRTLLKGIRLRAQFVPEETFQKALKNCSE